jgi:hypothetical protein
MHRLFQTLAPNTDKTCNCLQFNLWRAGNIDAREERFSRFIFVGANLEGLVESNLCCHGVASEICYLCFAVKDELCRQETCSHGTGAGTACLECYTVSRTGVTSGSTPHSQHQSLSQSSSPSFSQINSSREWMSTGPYSQCPHGKNRSDCYVGACCLPEFMQPNSPPEAVLMTEYGHFKGKYCLDVLPVFCAAMQYLSG